MATHSRPSAAPAWKRALSVFGATALVAGAIIGGGSTAAVAAPATFNPFDLNGGFTAVSQGNITLNNGEIEGSVAAFGSGASGNPNNYPIIHTAAGEASYTVPLIDGMPVRVLADSFAGAGVFELTNRDDSRTIALDSPEANAAVKFVNTGDLNGSQRGDFLRITNAAGGVLDLQKVSYAGADVVNYRTAQPSVASYFPSLEGRVAQANQCLAAMYDNALTNTVSLNAQGDMVFPSGYATDRPNVFDYADIAGKIIKPDNAAGYVPTAAAPIVIRVPAGTTEIGQLKFEGWSSQAHQQQSYARYIMLDMSAVSGDVKIDGFEMGAIWAPNANLNFNSGVTTNGQWFAGGNITTVGGGEIHHHAFLGNLPCAQQPEAPVEEPEAPVEEPEAPIEEPEAPVEEPEVPVEEPETSNTPGEDPETSVTPGEDPETSVTPEDDPEEEFPEEVKSQWKVKDPAGPKDEVAEKDSEDPAATKTAEATAETLAQTGAAGAFGALAGVTLLLAGGVTLLLARRTKRA